MKPKILILEDDVYRIRNFIEYLGGYDITITESFNEAKGFLANDMFDYVFLNAKGKKVIEFIKKELTYEPNVVIHTWDLLLAEKMVNTLPIAKHIPFNTEEFYEIKDLLW